jgi:hypothetical protein
LNKLDLPFFFYMSILWIKQAVKIDPINLGSLGRLYSRIFLLREFKCIHFDNNHSLQKVESVYKNSTKKGKRMKIIMLTIIGFFISLVTACVTHTQDIPTRTIQVKLTSTPTATATPTRTLDETVTATIVQPSVISYYSELIPGEYLIINDSLCNVWAIDLKSLVAKLLVTGICPFGRDSRMAGDHYISYCTEDREKTYLYDLIESKLQTYNAHCMYPSWSPDARQFLIALGYQCQVYSTETNKITPIIEFGRQAACTSANWSPDGKKILISRENIESVNPQKEDGIYILDTSCIEEPSSCMKEMKGPFLWPVHYNEVIWSSDSQQISFLGAVGFVIANISNLNQYHVIQTIGGIIFSSAWSLGDQFIAYDGEGEIYYLPVEGGQSTKVSTVNGLNTVVGWLSTYSRPEFKIGGKYVITSILERLNFREEPSLQGLIDLQLVEGDKLEIIGGPTQSDSATWWKAKLPDGMIGWVMENKYWYTPDD